MSRLLPGFLQPAALPKNTESILSWISSSLLQMINTLYRIVGDRCEEMIQEGTFANMPQAQGRRRFYYATDTDDLYYDAGAWKKVGHGT